MPPSSAGSGSTFTNARLMFSKQANYRIPLQPYLDDSAPVLIIARGPLSPSKDCELLKFAATFWTVVAKPVRSMENFLAPI